MTAKPRCISGKKMKYDMKYDMIIWIYWNCWKRWHLTLRRCQRDVKQEAAFSARGKKQFWVSTPLLVYEHHSGWDSFLSYFAAIAMAACITAKEQLQFDQMGYSDWRLTKVSVESYLVNLFVIGHPPTGRRIWLSYLMLNHLQVWLRKRWASSLKVHLKTYVVKFRKWLKMLGFQWSANSVLPGSIKDLCVNLL